MKKLILALMLLGFCFGNAFGYDPPEVIGALPGPHNENMNFCRVADTNGDGCDELLVYYQDTWGENPNSHYQFYLGGENMFDEIERNFTPVDQNEWVSSLVCSFENISPSLQNIIGINYWNPDDPQIHRDVAKVRFFDLNNPDAREPLFVLSRIWRQYPTIRTMSAIRLTPFDVNDDGWNDMITTSEMNGQRGYFVIYNGGADFDTIPDWHGLINSRNTGGVDYYSGVDINADGFDDLIVRADDDPNDSYMFRLYLGGTPMDTLPYAEIDQYALPDRNGNDRNVLIDNLTAVPDCNGDGYDDWAVCFEEHGVPNAIDGAFVFFGSEEPDWEPDLELRGHRRLWASRHDIAAGDFNNDGFGDIVVVYCNWEPTMGEIHIHFGSPWMDEETDVFINSENEYFSYFPLGDKVGGIGDYNGDGVDDFVVTCPANQAIHGGYYVVLAGNADWEVGVKPEQEPVPDEFYLDVYPNPFNDEVRISFNNPTSQNLTLKTYNIQGRELASLWNGKTSIGWHETVWTADKAGVYLAVIKTDVKIKAVKLVCIR